MNETLEALLSNEIRICELCGSNEWRILHQGDESNCECEGECLRVCDSTLLSDDGCDGVAILVSKGEAYEYLPILWVGDSKSGLVSPI
jgi:hypothetical protein